MGTQKSGSKLAGNLVWNLPLWCLLILFLDISATVRNKCKKREFTFFARPFSQWIGIPPGSVFFWTRHHRLKILGQFWVQNRCQFRIKKMGQKLVNFSKKIAIFGPIGQKMATGGYFLNFLDSLGFSCFLRVFFSNIWRS